jgi:signal transduction histidine kinase
MQQKRIDNIVKYSITKITHIIDILDISDSEETTSILKENRDSRLILFLSDKPIIPTNRNFTYENFLQQELQDSNRKVYLMTNSDNLNLDDFNYTSKKDSNNPHPIITQKNNANLTDYTATEEYITEQLIKHLQKQLDNTPFKKHNHNSLLSINRNNFYKDIQDFQPILFGSVQLKNGKNLIFGYLYNNNVFPPISSNVWYLIIITTLLGTLLFYLLILGITSPLNKLTKQTNILSRNYKSPPLPIEGPEEIQELMKSFNRMQESLSSFITERTRILASISHDLKTPLTSIMLRAQFLPDCEDKTKLIKTIETMSKMIKATLSFIKSEEEVHEVKYENLPNIIKEICTNYQDNNQPVTFLIGNNYNKANNFLCNQLDMHRILQNLIDNALTYGEKANIQLHETEHNIQIDIIDEGNGIPKDQIEKVLSPYYRLDKARDTSEAHTGLGLAIVRNIIIRQGGILKFENLTPKGLKVTIVYTI